MIKIKSKKQIIREAVVLKMIGYYGIEYRGASLMSLYDLAYNINNTWNADKFCNSKKLGVLNKYAGRFALPVEEIYLLLPAIRRTLKGSDIGLEKSSNGTEYIVVK